MDHIELTERGSSGFRLLSSSDGPASKSSFVSFMDEAKESPDQPSPPKAERLDGGLKAWLQVVGSFCLFFTSWGIVNTFGTYQTYYERELLSHVSSSQISWIGSVQAYLLVVIGVVTGPIFDRGYLRTLLFVGSFLTVFGLMMTSIAKSYYQVLLAQGFCVGLGSGCLFVPSLAVVATYFTTKRAFATGISVAGSSVGGVILPITFRKLLPTIGFGWATRVLAFISLALLLVAILVLRTRVTPKQSRSLLQLSAFKMAPYTLNSIGILVGFCGLYFPMFYIQSYALARTSIKGDYAFYLLAIINASSAFGRVIPNFLADKIGPLNMLTPCTLAAGILCLGWIDITDVAGITVFSVFYGFFSGAFVSLLPPTIAALTPDMTVVGTWMGMSLFIGAFGLLIGNPIAGALLDGANRKFRRAQGFAGGTILAAAILFGIARILRSRQRKTWKV